MITVLVIICKLITRTHGVTSVYWFRHEASGDGAESDQSGTKEFKVRGLAVLGCVSGDNNVEPLQSRGLLAAAAGAAPRWLTNTPHVQPRLDQQHPATAVTQHTPVPGVITPSGDPAWPQVCNSVTVWLYDSVTV